MEHSEWYWMRIWIVRACNWVCNHHIQILSGISTLWCYIFSFSGTHTKSVGLNFITSYGNHTVQFFAIWSALPRVFFALCAILAHFFLAYLLWSPCVNSLPPCSRWVKSAQTASSCDCWAGYPHTVGEILATPSKAVRNSWQILSRWESFPLGKDPPIPILMFPSFYQCRAGEMPWQWWLNYIQVSSAHPNPFSSSSENH